MADGLGFQRPVDPPVPATLLDGVVDQSRADTRIERGAERGRLDHRRNHHGNTEDVGDDLRPQVTLRRAATHHDAFDGLPEQLLDDRVVAPGNVARALLQCSEALDPAR